MFCVGSWKGLRKRAAAFEDAGATLVGVACDSPEQLRTLRDDHDLPFLMLSDPTMQSAKALDGPRASLKGYLGARALHPVIRHYPQRSFLQPALFVWKSGELRHEWRQTETLANLYGARGRPNGEQILDIVRKTLA